MSDVLATIPSLEGDTAESAVKFVKKASLRLIELQDLSDLKCLSGIVQMFCFMYANMTVIREEISKAIVKYKTIHLLTKIIILLKEKDFINDIDIWSVIYFSYATIWNYSDFGNDVPIDILKTRLPKILINNITHEPYLLTLQDKKSEFIIEASVAIVHNISRHPGLASRFKCKRLKEALVRLIPITEKSKFGLSVVLTLACIVDDSELELLEQGRNNIRFLIGLIKCILLGSMDKFIGYSLWELLNGIKMITVNDNMKKAVVREDGLSVLIAVLRNPPSNKDLENAIAAMWNLCFDRVIREFMVSMYDLHTLIEPYKTHEMASVRRSSDGIMWLIENKQIRSESPSKSKTKFDVFLSYAWENKDTVLSVKNELSNSGIRVWIDVEQMKGSTLEAMAAGIENCSIFLMSVSDAYYTSANCRAEAEYAYSLNKRIIPLVVECRYKPTGWLGFLKGSKVHFEFSERKDHNCELQKLLVDINQKSSEIEEKTAVEEVCISIKNEKSNVQNSSAKTIQQWSKVDVRKWLNISKLGHLKPKFEEFDGTLLVYLLDIKKEAPEYFYRSLKSEYGLKLMDVARFKKFSNGLK